MHLQLSPDTQQTDRSQRDQQLSLLSLKRRAPTRTHTHTPLRAVNRVLAVTLTSIYRACHLVRSVRPKKLSPASLMADLQSGRRRWLFLFRLIPYLGTWDGV